MISKYVMFEIIKDKVFMVNDENSCSVTVFILANNETDLLKETISHINELKYYNNIKEIVVVAKSKNSACIRTAEELSAEKVNSKIRLYIQKANNIENCLGELPPQVKTSHFVFMVADMEMNPCDLDVFIEKAIVHPERIICASKWHKDSVLEGYNKTNQIGAFIIKMFIRLLYGVSVGDAFTLFQIYPFSIYNKLNIPITPYFACSYTLKALRNGVEYEEIPTTYKKRATGRTNFNFFTLFRYELMFIFDAIRIRFSPKEEAFKNTEKQE